ncbi:MAG: UDP-3-O-(3-hydroxymyristoyl)glucosamine N-acyltransferase, partial [Mariprofundaceae bacterium]|nr:UDP-3-O-(3-hydroxymyristoyl)glucosamine N-acyltransferase [Mariprofundaceae bacterium]
VIAAGCLIAQGVHIGKDCLLHMGVKVLAESQLHDRVILQAGAVIGSDGFGYAWNGKEHLKIPQVGRVVLHDDVEIGANTCIDRGALGDTVIQKGVKLDNLIQIGHNVEIGALTVMASQAGIAGSTTVGKGCQIGGQAAAAGHLNIGDGCQLAARTGVISSLDAGGVYAGMPAMPHRAWLKTSALIIRLPEIWKKIKSM